SREMMPVPGAATLTHGPCMLKSAKPPVSSMAATDRTSSENHGGVTIVVGFTANAWSFCLQLLASATLPAADTITTSFCRTAYRIAAHMFCSSWVMQIGRAHV